MVCLPRDSSDQLAFDRLILSSCLFSPYVSTRFSCPPPSPSPFRDVACIVKFFSMKMKHVPEAQDIPSFSDAVGADKSAVEHHLDVVAQASGFSEEESRQLDAFVSVEGWGADDEPDNADDDPGEPAEGEDEGARGVRSERGPGTGAEASDGEAGSGEGGDDGSTGARDSDVDGESVVDDCGSDLDQEGATKERTRRARAPEPMTKRVHAEVQRQRRAAGAGGTSNSSRNHQKRRQKGKILYKHRDY